MGRLLVSISICCFAALLLAVSAQASPQPGLTEQAPALIPQNIEIAQSGGSVGGRAGRGRKDLSGGGKPRKKTVTRRRKPNPCRRVVGTWNWTVIGVTITATFRANRTASTSNGLTGAWKCTGGKYTVTWTPFGTVDRFTISPNGARLTGKSTFLGATIAASRR